MNKVILIAAGGTGGHIFPGLAVAKQIQHIDPSIQIIWLGSKNGMENRIVPKYHYPLKTIYSTGLRKKSIWHLLKAPFLLTYAMIQTFIIFLKVKPNLVLGMGGFSSGLAGLSAFISRTPLFIHEQNAILGLTNRLLAPLSQQVYQAFDNVFPDRHKPITIGNPILFSPQTKQINHKKNLRVLVVGGSLGAKVFNQTIPLLKTRLNIVHQSGKGHFELLKKSYQNSINNDAQVIEFIDDIAALYAWSDVVICRAGAMTIFELMLSGSASILVPFPFAVDNHQTANAKILSKNNAAILLPQIEFNTKKLSEIFSQLSKPNILNMSHQAQKLAKPNSAKQLAQQLCQVLNS